MKIYLVLILLVALGKTEDNVTTTTVTLSNFSTTSTPSSTTLAQDNNSSTTIQPPTTIQPKNDSIEIPPNKSTICNRTDTLNTESYNCACDLTLNTCDLNCCCDIDCCHDSLNTFDCSKVETNLMEYYHGYGLQHCEVEEGFFCIINDNLKDPATNMKSLQYKNLPTYTWPEIKADKQKAYTFDHNRNYYMYGDPLLMHKLDKNEKPEDSIEPFTIPASLTDTVCHVHEPVRFIKNVETYCLKTVNGVFSYNSLFLRQIKAFRFFKKSPKVDKIEEDFINATIFICKYNLQNCTNFTFNNTNDVQEEFFAENGYDEIFQDIYIKFKYNVSFLVSAEIFFLSKETFVLANDEKELKIVQKISVEFSDVNLFPGQIIRKRIKGYSNQEVVWASRLLTLNITSPDNQVLELFKNNSEIVEMKKFNLKLPETREGFCILTDEINDPIKFNENSLTICKVSLEIPYLESNQTMNATDYCFDFQRQIIFYLFHNLNISRNFTDRYESDIFVSTYSNPQNATNKWNRVKLGTVPTMDFDVTDVTDDGFTCKKMMTGVRYTIHSTAKKSIGSIKYEHIIQAVAIDFGGFMDFKFEYAGNNWVKLQLQIIFLKV